MELTIERHGGVLTIALSGQLDLAVSAALAEALKDTIVEGDRAVILDLADVHFIGSAALRVVLLTEKYLKQRDAKLVLCGLSDPVRRVLRITGFERFLTIHETRAGAHASLAGRPPSSEDHAV